MTNHVISEAARQNARALSRWEGEGGALEPTTKTPEDGDRLVRNDRAKAQSFVTVATVRRVSRPPGSGH
jgi:hypothetical protein